MPIASKDWKEKKPLYRPVHSLVKGKKGSVYVIGCSLSLVLHSSRLFFMGGGSLR